MASGNWKYNLSEFKDHMMVFVEKNNRNWKERSEFCSAVKSAALTVA